MIHSEDRVWLAQILEDPLSEDRKLVYADWLDERGDPRANFLRQFVEASRTMDADAFPSADGLPSEWVDLTGYSFLQRAAAEGVPELKETLLRLRRPALRMITEDAGDDSIPVGGSKIGGRPDLPAGYSWPIGDQCRAIYNDETTGVQELAGFIAQVNMAEIADTHAATLLPKTGVLSFFSYQDFENDNPDVVGVMAVHLDTHPDSGELIRTDPPREPTEGNGVMPTKRLSFVETLDLPDCGSSPWADEMAPNPDRDYYDFFSHFRELNFENMLGYARPTSGDDPTPNKESRHLILLENEFECRFHIQIPEKELAAHDFGAITLAWVDFD